ncbi:P2Y purinoceptor 8-like [Rhineura floridana]|uniref:P2Y purinoceptor 8-like n=1 Tax=Rhineura floridana TaxID=261503 RepID=UPI002AC81684|nr:P2Y purinoceptor 8-like [Rhineura floridana]XP_061483010.1 P2Y purinoceptor 8-like [Rhineura floridana]
MPQDIPLLLTSRILLALPPVNGTRSVSNVTLEMLQSHVLQITLPVLFSVIFSISIPLNFVSLWFLYRYSRPWNPTIVFCINLTICDLMYSMILPFHIIYHLKGNSWPFGDVLCRIVTVLSYGNMHCSILTMMSISIERYLGIVHPLRYNGIRPIRTSLVSCTVIWLLVLLPLIPLMKTNLSIHIQELPIITCFDVLPKEMFSTTIHFITYFGSLVFFFFFLPLLIMGFCYFSIILTLLHSSSTQLRETKKQTVYLILVLLFVLTICYLPHIIMSIIHYVLTLQDKSFYVEYKISFATASLNCCFDPLVYYFGSKEFRRKIQKKLCRCVPVGFSENTPIFSEHDMQITPIQKAPKI